MTRNDIERAIEWFSDEKEYFVNMEGLPFTNATESANINCQVARIAYKLREGRRMNNAQEALQKAAEYMSELLGCPCDLTDWPGCSGLIYEDNCKGPDMLEMSKCWVNYFSDMVKEDKEDEEESNHGDA